mmetsp:Transcript_3210/g.7753  ORF Transcript_3210/g.7753 Transcript_3210/m.7753 type:complete len:285 (+) Transcript_3210:623-1477(+)
MSLVTVHDPLATPSSSALVTIRPENPNFVPMPICSTDSAPLEYRKSSIMIMKEISVGCRWGAASSRPPRGPVVRILTTPMGSEMVCSPGSAFFWGSVAVAIAASAASIGVKSKAAVGSSSSAGTSKKSSPFVELELDEVVSVFDLSKSFSSISAAVVSVWTPVSTRSSCIWRVCRRRVCSRRSKSSSLVSTGILSRWSPMVASPASARGVDIAIAARQQATKAATVVAVRGFLRGVARRLVMVVVVVVVVAFMMAVLFIVSCGVASLSVVSFAVWGRRNEAYRR